MQQHTDRYMGSLAQAMEQRGFKPFLGVGDDHPAFYFLSAEFRDLNLHSKGGVKQGNTSNSAMAGSTSGYAAGVTITTPLMERLRRNTGVRASGVDLDGIVTKLGLDLYKGFVVTGSDAALGETYHEFIHVRDLSTMPVDRNGTVFNYEEVFTDLRTVALGIPEFKPAYLPVEFSSDYHARMNRGCDARSDMVKALQNLDRAYESGSAYASSSTINYILWAMDNMDLSRLEEAALGATALLVPAHRDMFRELLGEVISLERLSPPMAEEVLLPQRA